MLLWLKEIFRQVMIDGCYGDQFIFEVLMCIGCYQLFVYSEHLKMGQAYNLVADARQITAINSMRVMVSAALLYTYTAYYVFLGVTHFFRKDVRMEAAHDMGRRLALYGIAALISISFLHYGIYHAIMAWLLLINVVIILAMILMRGVEERSKNIAITIYYVLIFIWFFGIVFFYMYNALNPKAIAS